MGSAGGGVSGQGWGRGQLGNVGKGSVGGVGIYGVSQLLHFVCGGTCTGLLEPRFFLGFVPFVGRVLQRIQRTAPQLDSEVGK